MVALARNWTVAVNLQPSSQVDQVVQARELVFAFINTHRLAGWTVARSSNGIVADNSDNIASASDIVFGNVSQARSWAVLTPPAALWGKGGSVDASETLQLLVAAFDSNADTTPQNVLVSFLTGGGTYLTSGTTTANPTASGGTESSQIGTSYGTAWVPWTAATNCRYATWYNDIGEVMFAIKATGENGFRHFYSVRTFLDADEGSGHNRIVFSAYSGASAGIALRNTYFFGLGSTRARTKAGTAELSGMVASSPAWNYTQWTNGQELDRGVPASGLVVGNNAAGAGARHFGWVRDVYICPTSTPENTPQDGDSDTIRLVACIADTGGGVWLPVPAASLPLE